MKILSLLVLLFILGTVFIGCPPTEVRKEETTTPQTADTARPAPIPELTIRLASLNLESLTKRIEAEHIDRFVSVLKEEKIDILALQGVRRYPGLASRIDLVDELAARTDMRSAFGETMNLSGRQTGHAVFSMYPIRSYTTTPYSGLSSTRFESALETIIDGGVGDLVVVSTLLPDKASPEEQASCIKTLAALRQTYDDEPVIVAGNLPTSRTMRMIGAFLEIPEGSEKAGPGQKIWYANEQVLRPVGSASRETDLGTISIAEFRLIRKPHP